MGLNPGTRLGPYEILAPLGAGGMGEVYRARDPRLGREVAVKLIATDGTPSPDRVRRFDTEARAVAALSHPNVVTIFDVGTHEGQPYLVLELLDGHTLRELLQRQPPALRQAVAWALEISRGLAAAHERGIVHRDLKPDNVLLTTEGRVKVLDFGLAKLREPAPGERSSERDAATETHPGHILGTAGYMAPEQVRGEAADARSDVFSLGAVLYEMVTRRCAFPRASDAEALAAILRDEPPPPSSLDAAVPPALEAVILRCLAKEPVGRFASAAEVAAALDTVLVSLGSGPHRVTAPAEPRGPYPGLSAFTEEDAERFFGREREVEALGARLKERRLLALIGPSGAGKTSFVRAGVVASRPSGWGAIVATPGGAPMRALAQALVGQLPSDPETLRQLLAFDDEEVALDLVRRWRQGHAEALLVVDQFEELSTLNPPEVQARFASLLGRLAGEADVHVLLSMRDDFLIRCHEHEPLEPVFQNLTPILALGGDDLRRALVEPAKREGFGFEDEALVAEMLEAVEGTRGALPLLAFAVARLWEKRDRERKLLTRAAYEEIGGVAGALAQHADETLQRIGLEREPIVRELFRNLVTAQSTRAAADREELLSVLPDREAGAQVLDQLVDARLLTSYEVREDVGQRDEGGEQKARHRIEVVHESLLRAWPRLVRWQAQDEEGAVLRDQLKQAAHLWEEKGRPDDLLWTGTSEREFELWRERYPGKLTAVEDDFAKAMVDRTRRRRRLRRAAVATLVVGLAAVAIAIGLSRQQAMRARDRARAEARRAEASKLLALGRAELDRYPAAAVAYARKSLEVADTPEGRRFVVDALWRSPTARILPLGNENSSRADFSPDGRWLAAFAWSGHLLLFGDDGAAPRIIQGQPPTAWQPRVRFTPSGDALLAQSLEEACVHMYGVPDGREIRRFEAEPPGGYGAIPRPKPGAVSPMDWTPLPHGILFHWFPDKPSPGVREPFGIWPYDGGPPTLTGSLRSPGYAVVDPHGSRFVARRGPWLVLRSLVGGHRDAAEKPLVAAGEFDPRWWAHGIDPEGLRVWAGDIKDGVGRLRVWSIRRGAPPEPRILSVPKVEGTFLPAWDPTGSRVAWGSSAEKAVWLWDLAGPPDAAPIILRRPDTENTGQAVFTPNREWLLVTNHSQHTLWALAQPWVRVLTGHAASVHRLLFAPDSQGLLSCGQDSVRLWPLGPGRGGVRRIATEAFWGCQDAAFSPDGQRLLVGGGAGAWLAQSSFEGRGRWLWGAEEYLGGAATWDASGRRVAVGSAYATTEPNAIGLFDLPTGRERRLSLLPPGETGQGYDWGVLSLAFTPEGRLLAGGSGGVRWIDPETGASDWVWRLPKDKVAPFALSADGRRFVAASGDAGLAGRKSTGWEVMSFDLGRGERRAIRSHGDGVTAVDLDMAGRTLVTGDEQGVVRVGLADGREPHRLCCHAGRVNTVAISPDGRWIASASGSEIRLWPMPDVTKPPLHASPYEELMAKLRALTNLQVVEDEASFTGYKLDIGPFPGWKDVPTW